MKKNIKVLALRGGNEILKKLKLGIENKVLDISLDQEIESQYNIRFIIENVSQNISYPDKIFGNKITEKKLGSFSINEKSNVFIKDDNQYLDTILDLNFIKDKYDVGIKVYLDSPVNEYTVLKALPIPTNLITIYIYFCPQNISFESKSSLLIEKHFDGYSHLGFFLTDLSKMKDIIYNNYGNKELDLIHEFSTTEIIEELFDSEIIMIAWGINPYTYPIYSCDNPKNIEHILGNEYREEGVFNINEDIRELSLVPGNELKNWPYFLDKDWPKIKLFGKGKKTYLKPYYIEDKELDTVFTSFLIYREEGSLDQVKPLINVDLLYS